MLNTAPKPPDYFVIRQKEGQQLLDLLLRTDEMKPQAVALQGGGGFGKTTLAQWLCYHPQVQDRFRNGIIWLTVGQTPNLATLHDGCLKKLQSYYQVNLAKLSRHQILIVLDDVWHTRPVRYFKQDNQTCDYTYLITTRDKNIPLSVDVNATAVDVSRMSQQESAELLLVGLSKSDDIDSTQDMVDFLGEWPLLLKLVNAQLRIHIERNKVGLSKTMAYVTKRLQKRSFCDLKVNTEEDRNQAIGLSLELSLEQLGEWRERYLELAIFPDDTNIPFEALGKLWYQTASLDEFDCDDALLAIERFSLFDSYDPDPDNQTVRLHDVVRHYLLERYQDNPANLINLHQQFLNAYRSNPKFVWADLPHNEPYLWDNLAYHLVEAGQTDELLRTVKDLRYLATKSYVCSTTAVAMDIRSTQSYFFNDDQLSQLEFSFRNDGHIQNRCNSLSDYETTLYSRLYGIEGITSFCQIFLSLLTPPYMIPYHPLPDIPPQILIRTFTGHIIAVYGCVYSPDGQTILSASGDRTLKLWDITTGECIRTFQGHNNFVKSCVYSPDGQTVLSASKDNTLKLWDVITGECIHTFEDHTSAVWDCTYSPDGQTILSASHDNTLKLWDISTRKCIYTFKGHTDWVSSCAYSPDSQTILSGSRDNTLKLWDIKTKKCIRTIEVFLDINCDCGYSPDGQTIFSASHNMLKLWDVATGECIHTFECQSSWIEGCVYSPDSQTILSACDDNTLKLWDIKTGQCIHIFEGHTDRVWDCMYSPDSQTIVSASNDRTLKLWTANLEEPNPISATLNNPVSGCAYSPDGQTILAACDDNMLKLYSVISGECIRVFEGHGSGVTACAYSPDGQTIISTSWDRTLKLWDVRSGECIRTFKGHASRISDCVYSPDGLIILSVSWDRTLKLWNMRNGECIRTFEGHTDKVVACAYSPDGQTILSAAVDRTLKLWQVETGKLIRTMDEGHKHHWINDCTYSPDGQTILSASGDRTLKLWNVRTGEYIQIFEGHRGTVKACAYSPDEQTILSVSGGVLGDYTTKLWNTKTGECLTTLAVAGPLEDCVWSPNGRDIVVVGGGGVYFLQVVF